MSSVCPLIGQISKNDRGVLLSMLHQVREDVEKHYYDPSFHGIDLEAKFAAAERELKTVDNINQAMGIVADTVLELDDSHTTFFPPQRATRVDYGWQMAIVGDAPLVVDVTEGSDAAARGLAPGDLVLSLNRFAPTRANIWQIEYLYRFIRPQAQQRVVVRQPDGTERTLDVESKVVKKPVTEIADVIDDLRAARDAARDVEVGVGSDVIAWKMPSFVTSDQVKDAMKRVRPYKTLILDLRANGGGAVSALDALVERTFDRDVLVATEHRRGKETKEVVKGAKDAFAGRLIVLVDSRSASASEMFARIVQLEHRGTVIGDRTAGAVMTGQFFPHGAGIGAVTFYGTIVTVSDVRMSDGNSLEHVGVQPDELLLPTQDDLAAGRDPVLARALALAGVPSTADRAAKLFSGPR